MAVFPPPEPRVEATGETWPGQVFDAEGAEYGGQMAAYAEQRAAKQHQRRGRRRSRPELALLRAEVQELRCQRRRQRWARRTSDEVWRAVRQERRRQRQAWWALSRAEKRQQRVQHQAQEESWQALKAASWQEMEARRAEDAAWRQARQALRGRQARLAPAPPPATVWLAILVVIDNCTRRCLGLPLFTAGVHVTAEMVVEALRALLPAELQFLISDNGPQFTAQAFAALAKAANFIHVRIAPHRGCTNGIAERFIGTLKGWLANRAWTTAEELIALLAEFQAFYDDRPHQGAELKGLSPNEYARRLSSSSTC